MSSKEDSNILQLLWVKSILYGLILLVVLTLFITAPKKVFTEALSYRLATSMSIVESENLLFYDYDVYATEERFNQGLIDDVNEVKTDFKERFEVLAVQVYGDEEKVELRDDYIFITNPDTIELNIEYYLVKDLEFNDMSISNRTFIMLFNDISQIVNHIYLAIIIIVGLSFFTPFAFKFTRNLVYLRRYLKDHPS
jgi:hypothetical protein